MKRSTSSKGWQQHVRASSVSLFDLLTPYGASGSCDLSLLRALLSLWLSPKFSLSYCWRLSSGHCDRMYIVHVGIKLVGFCFV